MKSLSSSHPKNQLYSRQKQSGLGLFGLIFLAAIVVMVAIVGMKVVPTVIEYSAIQRAVKKAVRDGGDNANGIRRQFDLSAAVEDISSIKGADLEVVKAGDRLAAKFKYEKRIPLVGPASLVIDYEGSSGANP